MAVRVSVNAPSVVSEIIDGEAVILNLQTGRYHSTDRSGAVVWSWIEAGRTLADIEHLACRRYEAPDGDVLTAVRSFFEALREHDLIREEPTSDAESAEVPSSVREPFTPPTLTTFTDMGDLLLLDPIHDVDAAGWPKPKDDSRS